MSNAPLSEQFRLAAKDWVEKEGAARLLEEGKTATLAERMNALGDVPVSHAERDVKASPEWRDYIRRMCEARTAANLAKVKLEFLRMRHMEQTSYEATARMEAKL